MALIVLDCSEIAPDDQGFLNIMNIEFKEMSEHVSKKCRLLAALLRALPDAWARHGLHLFDARAKHAVDTMLAAIDPCGNDDELMFSSLNADARLVLVDSVVVIGATLSWAKWESSLFQEFQQ